MLTHSPYEDVPIHRGEDFDRAFAKTLAMASAVRETTHLQVFVALGPYPGEFVGLRQALGREAAIEAMRKGIDRAARQVAGGTAVGWGGGGRADLPGRAEGL